MRLAIIWQWKETKGLPYAEDLQNYEIAQAQLISENAGARVLAMGPKRLSVDGEIAYPFAIINA
ncbi:MAG: hypothetical protein AAFW60_12655 [Pseudomonadota bacterium]